MASTAALAGRRDELGVIASLLMGGTDAAARLVVGDAGIGKSRLVAAGVAVGPVYLVGPNPRLWVLSSNQAIHDLDIGVRLLELPYREGLANNLDQSQFENRLRVINGFADQ